MAQSIKDDTDQSPRSPNLNFVLDYTIACLCHYFALVCKSAHYKDPSQDIDALKLRMSNDKK